VVKKVYGEPRATLQASAWSVARPFTSWKKKIGKLTGNVSEKPEIPKTRKSQKNWKIFQKTGNSKKPEKFPKNRKFKKKQNSFRKTENLEKPEKFRKTGYLKKTGKVPNFSG
jgi:hypothetical protein